MINDRKLYEGFGLPREGGDTTFVRTRNERSPQELAAFNAGREAMRNLLEKAAQDMTSKKLTYLGGRS